MLNDLQNVVIEYGAYEHLKKCKIWDIVISYINRTSEPNKVYAHATRFIKKRKLPLKFGDIVHVYSKNRRQDQYYIYDGRYLLNHIKYYNGGFKVWEIHPTTGIFIERNYWGEIYYNNVFFDHEKYTSLGVVHPTQYEIVDGRLLRRKYKINIYGRQLYIDGGLLDQLTSQRFTYYSDDDINTITMRN
jgi:hypothetical protein